MTLLLLFSSFGTASASWDGVSVKSVTPKNNIYKIYTAAELAWIAQKANSVSGDAFRGNTVMLMNDIDLAKPDKTLNRWTPIGLYNEKGATFSGIFDGQGHRVSNMFVSSDTYLDAGFLGSVSGDAKIKNLAVFGSVRSTVKGSATDSATAGCLVGVAYGGLFENCRSSGDVTLNSSSNQVLAGLLIGVANSGTVIKNARTSGIVTISEPSSPSSDTIYSTGGIAGTAINSKIINAESHSITKIITLEPTKVY